MGCLQFMSAFESREAPKLQGFYRQLQYDLLAKHTFNADSTCFTTILELINELSKKDRPHICLGEQRLQSPHFSDLAEGDPHQSFNNK